jgi:Domain of unknown function (DUF4440)
MRVLFTSVVLVGVLAVGGLLAQSAGDALWRPKTGSAPSLVPPGTPAPGNAESAAIAEVIAFEKATEAAVVRGDTAYLERALAPTFLFTHGDGWVNGGAPLKIDTKESWIEYVKRKPSPYVYRELDHQQVELHGDVAITLGRYFYLPQSNNGNAAHMHVWFERVYAKRNGQWQQLSHRTVKGPLRDDAARSTQ